MNIFAPVIAGDVDATQSLVKKDKKLLAARDGDDRQPLHLAAIHGHEPIARLLLDAKAKVNVKDKSGLTAAAYAALFGHRAIYDLLRAAGGDPTTVNKYGGGALHTAVADANVDAVRLLLEAGADASAQGKNGPTPLHNGARGSSLHDPADYRKIASMLINAGANLEALDENGMTPLLVACYEGHGEMAELLLDAGADYESCGGTDCTPLLVAVVAGRLATVRMLLKRGADAAARSSEERDALEEATYHRHRFIAELIAKHTKTKAKPLSGKASGTELAKAVEFDDVADARRMLDDEPDLLMKPSPHGVTQATPLDRAAYFGRESAAALLIQRGADVEVSGDDSGSHPLHTAAEWNRANVAALLIRAGAAVDPVDQFGRTPLHQAADLGQVETVRLLLDAGADAHLKTRGGHTALDIAGKRSRTSNPQSWENPADIRRRDERYTQVISLLERWKKR